MINSEILLVSLDFDGCADKPFSRDAIITKILETCRILSSIQKIVIMVGSLRQSVVLDLLNAFKHSRFPNYLSAEVLYSDFLPKLQQAIKDKGLTQVQDIEFAPLLLNDIYNQLATGETFKGIQHVFSQKPHEISEFYYSGKTLLVNNQFGEAVDLSSHTASRHMADTSKHSLIYAQAHHVKLAYPHQEILFQFYDDREDILRSLNQYFTKNQESLPSGLFLELLHFRSVLGFKPSIFKGITEGVGPLNPNYHAHILQIAELTAWKGIEIENPDFGKLLAEVLSESVNVNSQQAYVRLNVPASKEKSIPKKPIVINTDGQEQFNQQFSYHKDCPNLFELAFTLERLKRLSQFEREFWVAQAEYESLFEIYNEDDFTGIEAQLIDYADKRCQAIGLSKRLFGLTQVLSEAKETAKFDGPALPKKTILINSDGQEQFNQQFSYHKDCSHLFELAFTLERMKRLSRLQGEERLVRFKPEYREKNAEYESLLSVYNDFNYPNIKAQLIDYADQRCQKIGLSKLIAGLMEPTPKTVAPECKKLADCQAAAETQGPIRPTPKRAAFYIFGEDSETVPKTENAHLNTMGIRK